MLGLIVYALKTPVGIVCFIIIPCLIIIVFEVIRLVRVLGRDKKDRMKAECEKQASEIERLKRQIEMLKRNEETQETESREAKDETEIPSGSTDAK